MNEGDYYKILKDEKRKLLFSAVVLPSIMFVMLIFLKISVEYLLTFDDKGFMFTSIASGIVTVVVIIGYLLIEHPEAISLKYIRKTRELAKKYPGRRAIIQFEAIGFEKVTIRHIIQEKVFRFYVVVTVILAIIILSFLILKFQYVWVLVGFLLIPGMMVYVMILSRHFNFIASDSEFCFARGCFKIINNFKQLDDTTQVRYFISGLNNYDNYLKKNIKVRIKNLEKIYSPIISDDLETLNKSTETIHNLLEEGRKLDLLRYLAKLFGEENMKEMLEPEKFSKKFKDSFPVIITVITTGVLLIQFALSADWSKLITALSTNQ